MADRGPELTRRDALAMNWIGEQYGARLDVAAVLLGRLSPVERYRDGADVRPFAGGPLSRRGVRNQAERWRRSGLARTVSALGAQWAIPTVGGLRYGGLSYEPWAARGSRLEHAHAVAMVRLALANSRMKDFFDIHRLAETRTFDGDTMRLAVAATFTRRSIEIPNERPLALTSEFADDAQKKIQWAAFVRRARRPDLGDLSAIIATLDRFLWPVLQAAALSEPWPRVWSSGGPWKEP